jgi:protein-serine/threonine kinase
MTVGGSVGQNQGMGFGLHEPPKMRKAMSKLGNEGENQTQGDQAQGTATPPTHHSSPRGTLAVKLISARGLAVSHSGAPPEPYVVMQFEQNEFISRSPHSVSSHTSIPFTTAQAQPMIPASPVPGNLTRSASGLGVGTISRAFAEAMGRGKQRRDEGVSTPKAEEPQGSWLGKPGPGDPVWKEEVAL